MNNWGQFRPHTLTCTYDFPLKPNRGLKFNYLFDAHDVKVHVTFFYIFVLICEAVIFILRKNQYNFHLIVPIINCFEAGSDHPCLCILGLYDM